MAWIFERLGLRASLMGVWTAIRYREEHEFTVAGNKGVIPVGGLRTVPSLGFDLATFAKYGPLIVDVGMSPSWSNLQNSIQYRGLLGFAIPIGRNSELRILGGYRKFLTTTTNSNPIVRESVGPVMQIDLAALWGEKGAIVMTTRGSITTEGNDIQPLVALGGECLIFGQHELVRDHAEAELALDRANENLKAARDLLSGETMQAEMKSYGKYDDSVSTNIDVVERAVNALVTKNNAFTDLKDSAYAAAKYAKNYAVGSNGNETAQQLLKEINNLTFELKLRLATYIADDTFSVVDGIKQEGKKLKEWISKGGRSRKFVYKELDHYDAMLDRFQSLIATLTDGNIELLNVLADTSHKIRCLQGRDVGCNKVLMAISIDQLTKEFVAKIEGAK